MAENYPTACGRGAMTGAHNLRRLALAANNREANLRNLSKSAVGFSRPGPQLTPYPFRISDDELITAWRLRAKSTAPGRGMLKAVRAYSFTARMAGIGAF
jgi:hypothetical protein